MHDRDLFRTNLDRPAAGTSLYDLVVPEFNRLTLFDDRIPHAVQRMEGSMDPLEGRVVLHGHISEGGVVAEGGLTPDLMQEGIGRLLTELRAGPGQGAHGPLVYRIEIATDGAVAAIHPIFDRLASSSDA